MEKTKKKLSRRLLIFLIVLTVIFGFVIFKFWGSIFPRNVFEEIYYAQIYTGMIHSFSIDRGLGMKLWFDLGDGKFCISRYNGKLPQGHYIGIRCYSSPHKMIKIEYGIIKQIYSSKDEEIYNCIYTYSLEDNTLTQTITYDKEQYFFDDKYSDFLYETVLSEWFEEKGKLSRFSIDDLGKYIDNTEKD